MSKQAIAIVGLGRVGSVFLTELLKQESHDIVVVAVSEAGDTPGKALAESKGIPVLSVEQIVAKGDSIDILFDLTGVPEVRRQLRSLMVETKNLHTIIATETIARFVWALISSDQPLPAVHAKTGY